MNKNEEYVVCQECGKNYSRITNTHLWHKHQMTMEEYMEKYPDSAIETNYLQKTRYAFSKGKTYEEMYGEEKAQELKDKKKESAINQMQNSDQIKVREEKCGNRDYIESTKKMIETKNGFDGNYRGKALKYYGETCQVCGIDKHEGAILHVHHIDGNNFPSELGNHSIDNLQVVCTKCHTKIHKELRKNNSFINKNIETGMHYILKGLKQQFGLDLKDINFKDTPKRVAKAYSEIFSGINAHEEIEDILSTSFPSEYKGMIIASDIHCFSMCPHHFLPVEYYVDLAYIPKKSMLGISKLSRLVEIVAKQPLLQETFTQDIVKYLQTYIDPEGIIIQVKGRHMCMTMRGVKQSNSWTLTSEIAGAFTKDEVRSEFALLLQGSRQGLIK